ncbi:MAG: MFS transporter [Leptospirales bacterium]|nr:MFS transporter [Leptospirales bacterium]
MKWRLGAGYGAAETGIAAAEVVLQLYLLNFYIGLGLSPFLAGLALALAVGIDALLDPLVGRISDRSRFAMGRRRAFIALGALLLAPGFVALFFPPAATSWGLFAYLFALYLFVSLGLTVLSVPHSAFAGELVPDPAQRTTLFGFRLLFNCLGLIVGILSAGSESLNHSTGSLVVAAAVIVTAFVTVRSTRGLDVPGAAITQPPGPLLGGFFSALRNRAYLPLLLAFFFASIGRTLNSSLALYYYRYRLQLSVAEITVIILGLFVLVVSLSIIAWVLISRRYGKKMPAFLGITGLATLTALGYPLFPPGQLAGPIAAAILGGFFVASIILFESLVADIAEDDSTKSGEPREGVYFGFWKMATKVARALGLALSGWLLAAIGFSESAVSTDPGMAFLIGLIFGPGVAIFFFIAAGLFLLVPAKRRI